TQEKATGGMLVAADGVWSSLRRLAREGHASHPTETMAWRALVETTGPAGSALAVLAPPDRVTTFLNPALHLVVYPLRGGSMLNLVALTRGEADAGSWASTVDSRPLAHAMRGFAPALADLAE